MTVPDRPLRRVEPEPERLAARLTAAAQAWSPGVEVTSVRRLAHGASSLTYTASTSHAAVPLIVVKVAPAGLTATHHRDVLRQARVLELLSGDDGVPVPEALFTDPGDDEVGRLFAMPFREGGAYEPAIEEPPDPAPSVADLRGRALHAASILARLHAPRALGVDEEPAVSLVDEIERWDRALATLPDHFGLDWRARSQRLRSTMPAPWPLRLTHGDYRIGNMLCVGPRVTAVVDWEIWAVSDPRLDLGWFLLNLDPDHPAAVRPVEGLPTPAEILAAYGGEPFDHRWFVAAALYKFAATTGLIGKNALKRGEADSWGARMIPRLPAVLDRIDALLENEGHGISGHPVRG